MNIVLIVLDTARADEFQYISSETGSTFAELSQIGTYYENAYATAPWTLPSHAGLFTGTYSSKHGAHAGHKRLDVNLETIAEAFRDAGYETVGVSNNTWISDEFGFSRGFETFYKTWQYVQSDVDLGQVARTTEGGVETLRQLLQKVSSGNPLLALLNAFYGKFLRKRSDDGAKKTNEWISSWLESRGEDPFFLFVNYLEPHLEYRPPQDFAERYLPSDVSYAEAMDIPQDAWRYVAGDLDLSQADLDVLRALYRAEMAYLDQQVGDLVKHLKENDSWDDTLLVITGDHGENIGEHGLMDHQYSLHETLINVPLLVCGGKFSRGRTVSEFVQLSDLGVTLLDSADITSPSFREQTQGISFHPSCEDTREVVISEYLAPQPSMNALRERVEFFDEDALQYDRSIRTIRKGNDKLIRGSDGESTLYDLVDDPDESIDCSTEYPERVSELQDELDSWLESFVHASSDEEVAMSSETEARLEDLGYIQ